MPIPNVRLPQVLASDLFSLDMCNAEGELDNGCTTFLMDELVWHSFFDLLKPHFISRGSCLAMYILEVVQGKPAHKIGVSQTLNILFHVSAPL